uniref:Trafficking protein particle complex subunit 3-like n=1 Tax=Rhizophora mucronata TaxID=61149 RepID=A0A2P2N0T5_RHIMU
MTEIEDIKITHTRTTGTELIYGISYARWLDGWQKQWKT